MSPPPTERRGFARDLTLLGAVALIVGNMVGTSIYTLPASLAQSVGPLGIVAWALTAGGYLFVALVYARLGVRYARTGGPYVFAREAFGDFVGFQVTWSYWFSATIGNAGIAAAVVGYCAAFSPRLDESAWLQLLLAQALVWGLTLVNVLGVRHGARVGIAILFLNVVPLLVICAAALPSFDPRNLTPFAPQGWSALPLGAALVVWAYSGIESATVPAEEVREPSRTIGASTLIGYAVGTAVFLLSAVAVAGILPNEVAASSARPIALAAERALGGWAGAVVSIAAIVAGLGTLNGWILMAGRIPVGAARDGLFFARLARLHPRFGTPHVALLASGAISSAMLFLLLERSLLETFNFIVQLAVLTTLLPHLFAAAADLWLARREPERAPRSAQWTALVAFAFVLFTIYGCGPEVALWGFLVVLAGTPLFVFLRARPST